MHTKLTVGCAGGGRFALVHMSPESSRQNPKCCAGPMELDLESVASACLTQSGEATANVGLLRSCIQGSPDPAAALVKALKVFTSESFSSCSHQWGQQADVQPAVGMLGSNYCPAAVLQLRFLLISPTAQMLTL